MRIAIMLALLSSLALTSSSDKAFDRLVYMEKEDRSDPLALSDLYSKFHSYKNALAALPSPEWCGSTHPKDYCQQSQSRAKELEALIQKREINWKEDFPGLLERLNSGRLVVFEENELAAQYQSSDGHPQHFPELNGISQLKDFSFVTVIADDHRRVAISISQDIDPRGEISTGGYWAHISNDSGQTWSNPYYLGFAEQFPYVVLSNPKLPAFEEDFLQIPVELREVDEDSITFPPVGLRAKRIKKNIYLKFHIGALTKDSDNDGLTDLYEERIASDLNSKDTDRDGILDSADPQPLSPYRNETTDEDEVIIAAFKELIWGNALPIQHSASSKEGESGGMSFPDRPFSSQRVLFIQSEIPILVAYELPIRTIILPAKALEVYDKKFGPNFMLTIGEIVFNESRTRAFFKYDFGWQGGSFSARKKGRTWIVKKEEGWVT